MTARPSFEAAVEAVAVGVAAGVNPGGMQALHSPARGAGAHSTTRLRPHQLLARETDGAPSGPPRRDWRAD